MEPALFLQRLRDLPIEEGRAYLSQRLEELSDHTAIGELLAEEALRVLYTPMLSLKLAELLIYYGELTGHLPSHALGLKAKGDALFQIGHYQAAKVALDIAGEAFLSLNDEMNWARSRISWVASVGWLGHLDETLSVGKQAHDTFLRLGEPYWVCVIDTNIAILLEYSGHYEEALALYDNLLATLLRLSDQNETSIRRSIAIAQVNQGILLTRLGKFDRSYHVHQLALASFQAMDEMGLAMRVEVNLADLEYIQGYYGSALRRFYHVREQLLEDEEGNALLLAEVKIALANCLVKLNRTQEACILAEEAVQTYRTMKATESIGYALHEYATILVASGKFKDALAVLDETWQLFKLEGFDPLAFLAQLQRAEITVDIDSPASAYQLAHEVKAYFDSRSLVALSVRASLVMIAARLKMAQQASLQPGGEPAELLEEAALLGRQTMATARQYHLQEEVYKSHALMGRIFALEDDPARTVKQYRLAVSQIERILENLVYDLSPSFLRSTWSVYEELIAAYLRQGQYEQAFNYLERARSLTLRQYLHKLKVFSEEHMRSGQALSLAGLRIQKELKDWQERYHDYTVLMTEIDTSVSPSIDREIIQAELQRCETRLSELFERLHLLQLDAQPTDRPANANRSKKSKRRGGGLVLPRHIETERLRRHLQPEQLLLAYYFDKNKLVIFSLNRDGMMTYENPDGVAAIEYLLPFLHAYLQPDGWPDPLNPPVREIRRLLKKLYDLLIAPAASLLPTAEGNLMLVPYGSLHKLPFHALYDGSQYLVERFNVSYLPASSLLTQLQSQERWNALPSAASRPVAKPPLVFGYAGQQHIQRVHEEAQAIASMLQGNCYLEENATIARLMDEAPNSPLIHLATHGKSRLDAPNFSYVRLADGQLNAIDAFSMNLKGCELVTLSGCETGLALSSGGDEQLGLGRAFLAAGATSLVMSLWPVEDNATSELMQLFYRHLLQGASKVQALRAAQCRLLEDEQKGYAHPYFWAAFRLVGDIGPIHYKEKQEIRSVTSQPLKKSSPVV